VMSSISSICLRSISSSAAPAGQRARTGKARQFNKLLHCCPVEDDFRFGKD
jgi:hypothetical protein